MKNRRHVAYNIIHERPPLVCQGHWLEDHFSFLLQVNGGIPNRTGKLVQNKKFETQKSTKNHATLLWGIKCSTYACPSKQFSAFHSKLKLVNEGSHNSVLANRATGYGRSSCRLYTLLCRTDPISSLRRVNRAVANLSTHEQSRTSSHERSKRKVERANENLADASPRRRSTFKPHFTVTTIQRHVKLKHEVTKRQTFVVQASQCTLATVIRQRTSWTQTIVTREHTLSSTSYILRLTADKTERSCVCSRSRQNIADFLFRRMRT